MYYYRFDWIQAEYVVANVLWLDNDLLQGNQWFKYTWSDGTVFCKQQVYNRASQAIAPREHTRLRDNHPSSYYVTASPIHKDDPSSCGDVAVSFDRPRNWAADVLTDADGYGVAWLWTGNTLAIRQCDGRYVASDGYYLYVARISE